MFFHIYMHCGRITYCEREYMDVEKQQHILRQTNKNIEIKMLKIIKISPSRQSKEFMIRWKLIYVWFQWFQNKFFTNNFTLEIDVEYMIRVVIYLEGKIKTVEPLRLKRYALFSPEKKIFYLNFSAIITMGDAFFLFHRIVRPNDVLPEEDEK